MILPKNADEREQLFAELITRCMQSQQSRIAIYRDLRNYYLFGTQDGSLAPYNKLQPTVQLLKSFIYSAETTKFNLQLGNTVPPEELKKVRVLNEEINETWHDTNIDIQMGEAVEWSYTFGAMIVKLIYDKDVKSYLVDPGNFGVLNEQESDLNRQEAVCQTYTISLSELTRMLESHPHKTSILDQIQIGRVSSPAGVTPEGLKRLIITTTGNTIAGSVEGGLNTNGTAFDYNPAPSDDLITMYELYVFNDEISDYQMITLAEPGIVIYDRPNVGVRGYLPFIKVCPEPLPFYFWGQSFLGKLTPLQDWYTLRINQLKELLDKQVNPPIMISAMEGLGDDKYAALRMPGGIVDIGSNGSAKSMAPDIPQQLFSELRELDTWFAEMSGVNHLMQGHGESGVRSHGQTSALIRLSSARPRQAALIVEDALEQIAGQILRLKYAFSEKIFTTDETLSDGSPLTFTIGQFTKDYIVKVDSHSSSPIFVEDRKQDAQVLFKAQCIDRVDFLRMYDPPGAQQLVQKLEEKIEAEKQEAKRRQQMEEAKMAQSSGRPPSPGDQTGANDLKNSRSMGEAGSQQG